MRHRRQCACLAGVYGRGELWPCARDAWQVSLLWWHAASAGACRHHCVRQVQV